MGIDLRGAEGGGVEYGVMPSLRGSTFKTHFGSDAVVTKPAATVEGDLLVHGFAADVRNQNSGNIVVAGYDAMVNAPTQDDTTLALHRKRAGAAEGDLTVSARVDVTDGVSALLAIADAGLVGPTVMDARHVADLTIPALDVRTPRQLLVLFAAFHTDAGDVATPSGWTFVGRIDRWWPELAVFVKDWESADPHPSFAVTCPNKAALSVNAAACFSIEAEVL